MICNAGHEPIGPKVGLELIVRELDGRTGMLHGSPSNLSVGRETRPLLTQLAGDAILETGDGVGNQRGSVRLE